MKGKAYANRKSKDQRPIGDFYSTPKSLVWIVVDVIRHEFPECCDILEPCAGELAISDELRKIDFDVILNDLYMNGDMRILHLDYLNQSLLDGCKYIVTNPPFSEWDAFVHKAKTHAKRFMFLGRLNYFGTANRQQSGIWDNLKMVYPFNRYVDYRTPYRDDGHFHVGAMATAWFLWDMDYTGMPGIEVLDVNRWATLGAFKHP